MGGEPVLPAQVFDFRIPDGDQLHRVLHEPLVESLFAFLFKYRPFVFAKGHFALSAPWSALGMVAFGIVVLGALSFSYTRGRGRRTWQYRAMLGAIRGVRLAALLFCL